MTTAVYRRDGVPPSETILSSFSTLEVYCMSWYWTIYLARAKADYSNDFEVGMITGKALSKPS
jgi:hypothetical protein